MELRRWSLCLAFLLLTVLSQSSEARHSLQRREATSATDYSEVPQNDAATDDDMQNDYGQQNDADAEDEDEVIINASIQTHSNHYKPNVGDSLRLECRTDPSENVVVSWTKNKDTKLFIGPQKVIENMDNAPRFSLQQSDLIIRDVKNDDSGTYTCEVLQANPVSVHHSIFVTEPARIAKLSATSNGQVVENAEVKLTCEASGSPPPAVYWSWSNDGGITNTRLTDADGKFSGNQFIIPHIKREQAGIYYCLVANSDGQSPPIDSIAITVASKPKVHEHRPIVNTAVGTEAELICTSHLVHGETTPSIQWFKDNRPIEESGITQYKISTEGSKSTLTITPQRDHDFGSFTCTARNHHGSHSRWIELVQTPVIEDLDSEGPKISWTIHSHQKLDAIELHLKNLNKTDEDWIKHIIPIPESANGRRYEVVYEIQDENIDGQYYTDIRVKNEKGWNKKGDPVVINFERPRIVRTGFARNNPNSGVNLRPTTAVLSTVLMYLLVRMF